MFSSLVHYFLVHIKDLIIKKHEAFVDQWLNAPTIKKKKQKTKTKKGVGA